MVFSSINLWIGPEKVKASLPQRFLTFSPNLFALETPSSLTLQLHLRQKITKVSGILPLLELADKGFLIQHLLHEVGAKLIIPPFRLPAQFNKKETEESQTIAHCGSLESEQSPETQSVLTGSLPAVLGLNWTTSGTSGGGSIWLLQGSGPSRTSSRVLVLAGPSSGPGCGAMLRGGPALATVFLCSVCLLAAPIQSRQKELCSLDRIKKVMSLNKALPTQRVNEGQQSGAKITSI
ncbi:hypothetical protein CCH79_00018372 [Gambusia affinis]|uniref:Uncharacterized protein n=1 Tax=Gambusia affinis TaxID=33528 RepID=A0A315V7T4_GAMAF|nr:hypothetical protein CCH79_00018372 [Gambusia affinis]